MKKSFIILSVFFCTLFLLSSSFAKCVNDEAYTQDMFRIGNWDVEADLVSANGGCYKLHVRIYQIETDGAKTLVAYGDVRTPADDVELDIVSYKGSGFEGGNVSLSTFLNILKTDNDSWHAYVHARDEALAGYGFYQKTSSKLLRAQVGVNFDVHYKPQTLKLSANENIAFDAIVIYNQVHQPVQKINLEQKLKLGAQSQKSFELQIPEGIYDVALVKNKQAIGHRQQLVKD